MSLLAKRPATSPLVQFRERVKLDRNTLDIAAEEQPELYLEIAEQKAYASSRLDAARDELGRTDASLGREIRAELAKVSKPTEGMIADQVLGRQQHLGAAAKVAKAKQEVDEWSALVSAFEHRKSMIRELATLYASGYYTAGSARSTSTKVRDADAAAGREALARARQER